VFKYSVLCKMLQAVQSDNEQFIIHVVHTGNERSSWTHCIVGYRLQAQCFLCCKSWTI